MKIWNYGKIFNNFFPISNDIVVGFGMKSLGKNDIWTGKLTRAKSFSGSMTDEKELRS